MNSIVFVEFTFGDRVQLTALKKREEEVVLQKDIINKSGNKRFVRTIISPEMFIGIVQSVKIFDDIGMVQYQISTGSNTIWAVIHISAQQSFLFEWGKSYELARMIKV